MTTTSCFNFALISLFFFPSKNMNQITDRYCSLFNSQTVAKIKLLEKYVRYFDRYDLTVLASYNNMPVLRQWRHLVSNTGT